jgi:2-polyprenyl-6-methoxyphenol hydroxylase-like FAD-dependent oxidoreductase
MWKASRDGDGSCALRTDDPSDRLWVQHPTLDTRPDAATDRGANGGVEFFPGFSARELRVDQGRICGVSAQGEGDAKLDVEAKLVVGADGRNSRVAELADGLPKRLQTLASFISRTTAICR